MQPEQTLVRRRDELGRYEIQVGKTVVGSLEFEDEGDTVRFIHTEVGPEQRGAGAGSQLVAEAVADATRRGQTIVPECPYVAKYLSTHDAGDADIAWPE